MALLERGLKQRIVGALVLIALAVIFLPMLFTREDEIGRAHPARSEEHTPSDRKSTQREIGRAHLERSEEHTSQDRKSTPK